MLMMMMIYKIPKTVSSTGANRLRLSGECGSEARDSWREQKKAEEEFTEALEIRRSLAKSNPSAFLPGVAMTLNNLAVLHRTKNELKKAEKTF